MTGSNWLKITTTPLNQVRREKIERDVASFLERGGSIQKLPHGASAWNEEALVFMPKKLRRKK